MESVTGPDVEPLLPPLLPHAVATSATAAAAASTFQRLTAVSSHLCSAVLSPRGAARRREVLVSSGPPDDWLDEPAVLLRRGPQEVQVATLRCLQHVVAVERGPAAQVCRGRRRPRRAAPGQFAVGHGQVQ